MSRDRKASIKDLIEGRSNPTNVTALTTPIC